MASPKNLSRLRSQHPWPDQRPDLKPIDWCLEAGGKHLVLEQIKKHDVRLILEIGVFLGGSARQWLDVSDQIHLIAVDPWPQGQWIGEFADRHHQPQWVRDQLTMEDGFYQSFLCNMWPYRDRVTFVRGEAMQVLESIHASGVSPDMVYLDGDKTGREIEVCDRLFPEAILTGDDWFCGIDHFLRPDDGYPIRKPVREFCRKHNRRLLVDKSTWVISKDRPSWKYQLVDNPRYQMKSLRRRARGIFRGLLGLDKAA